MSRAPMVPLEDLMAARQGSVDPAKFVDETFELYSIPAFDSCRPEVVTGGEIGSTKQLVRPQDVLLSKIVPHIRRSWIVGAAGEYRQIASGEWIVFRSEKVVPEYLRHALLCDDFHAQFMQTVSGVGGSLLRARPAQVAKIEVPLPRIAEQRRIADILDKADALRIKRREALAQLDRLAQSILVEMFGDPSSSRLAFDAVPLIDLAQGGFQNGAYFPKEMYSVDGIEMVHMSDAFGGVVERGDLRRVACSDEEVAKYELHETDLLIARRSLTYEGAAKPCRIPASSERLIFESSFIRIRPDLSKVSNVFLFHYLNSERVREKHVRPYVTQSTISGINQSNLARVPVMLPPIALQRKFERAMASLGEIAQVHERSSTVMNELFAALQDRAFQGRL